MKKNILFLIFFLSIIIALPVLAKTKVRAYNLKLSPPFDQQNLPVNYRASKPVYSENNMSNPYEVPISSYSHSKKVLQGGVAESKELPSGFYGTWSVSSKLIETNNPFEFKPRSSDVWVLENNKGVITLSNPVTGATASITVDEVKGNTAKFTRKSETASMREAESPEITIDGDSFYGTDLLVMEKLRNGASYKMDVVRYEIRGTKISGPTLKDIFSKQ